MTLGSMAVPFLFPPRLLPELLFVEGHYLAWSQSVDGDRPLRLQVRDLDGVLNIMWSLDPIEKMWRGIE